MEARIRELERWLGMKPHFTPVRSPQSDNMAGAFVYRFKRDYVRGNPLPDARTVIKLIESWIENYDEGHPHSALEWHSPHEFRRAKVETTQASGETGAGSVNDVFGISR